MRTKGKLTSSLIGTFNKKRSLISLYSTILFSHLGFSIITGAFFLYTLFHQTGTTDVDRCVNGSTESSKKEACETGFQVIRGIIVGLFVFIWLLELCKFLLSFLLGSVGRCSIRMALFFRWLCHSCKLCRAIGRRRSTCIFQDCRCSNHHLHK